MQIRAGVKVELAPTAEQRQLFASYAGTARFAYNWAITTRQEHYLTVVKPARERGDESVKSLSGIDLINRWNREKETLAPWWRDISCQVAPQASSIPRWP